MRKLNFDKFQRIDIIDKENLLDDKFTGNIRAYFLEQTENHVKIFLEYFEKIDGKNKKCDCTYYIPQYKIEEEKVKIKKHGQLFKVMVHEKSFKEFLVYADTYWEAQEIAQDLAESGQADKIKERVRHYDRSSAIKASDYDIENLEILDYE